jgi:hypothetical protein
MTVSLIINQTASEVAYSASIRNGCNVVEGHPTILNRTIKTNVHPTVTDGNMPINVGKRTQIPTEKEGYHD